MRTSPLVRFLLPLSVSILVSLLIPFSMASATSAAQVAARGGRCEALFTLIPPNHGAAFVKYNELFELNRKMQHGDPSAKLIPHTDLSYGSIVPIVRSLEKEGLYYEEIAKWFPHLNSSAKQKFQTRFQVEAAGSASPVLTNWLLALKDLKITGSTPREKLTSLLSFDDPFSVLSIKERSDLFDSSILDFNDLLVSSETPEFVTVGDDLGSYEVRLTRGLSNFSDYISLRSSVEEYLEGKVGHQHEFHAWPSDPTLRTAMAPYYIEILDSTTWYLYWRQMNRDPREVSSVLTHPYLGVYNTNSLNRLNKAVVNNTPEKFKDKYRMVGARAFSASADIPEQGDGMVPDWELRSGNKGIKREFVENTVVARLATGDYSGIRAYNSYQFNASASAKDLLEPFLSPEEVELVERFEQIHPLLKWSPAKVAQNHTRNRIMSPLLPWDRRLPMGFKIDILKQAQVAYAKGLLQVAKKFLTKTDFQPATPSGRANGETLDARDSAIEKLEKLVYEFSSQVRLDLDFERYLKPQPKLWPSIQVTVGSGKKFDVNTWPLGIEYSFRFPSELKPRSREEAGKMIGQIAQNFSLSETNSESNSEEGINPTDITSSHGHGLVVKYQARDRDQKDWRFEWDGIQRTYNSDGKIEAAWGGHMEVVSPKFSPSEIQGPISNLFAHTREFGMVPRRNAGGAHVNFDLEKLMQELPPEEGTGRLINLISYFESNQALILNLWQHPKRVHAAYPIKLSHEGTVRLMNFRGNWDQLGRLLYDIRYFNVYEGRKPKYVPLNLTSLMAPIVPAEYIESSLDIRSDKNAWFPNFNKVFGRGEARFFDAPTDEFMAALQIKYFRALLNKTFNNPKKILLENRFSDEHVASWNNDIAQWMSAVEEHLNELGLDPNEFRPLIWDSWLNRKSNSVNPRELNEHKNFLPAITVPRKISRNLDIQRVIV